MIYGHEDNYFSVRQVSLDKRGGLEIDPTSEWGSFITVITISQDPNDLTVYTHRPVTVGPYAYIGSNSVLLNCIIGEGAIIAAGTVVRSCEVKPWTMVAGNPPQVIARCAGKGQPWVYLKDKWTVLG